MTQWEYTITHLICGGFTGQKTSPKTIEEAQKMGQDGWELVAAVPHGSAGLGGVLTVIAFWKRPLSTRG